MKDRNVSLLRLGGVIALIASAAFLVLLSDAPQRTPQPYGIPYLDNFVLPVFAITVMMLMAVGCVGLLVSFEKPEE